MASVKTRTRVVAGVSIIFFVIGAAIGIYFGRIALPFLIWLIAHGSGILVVLFSAVFLTNLALVIPALIFALLTVWVSRFPVERRKWFRYIGIAAIVLFVVHFLTNFGQIVAGAPVAAGAVMDLIAFWYGGKRRR